MMDQTDSGADAVTEKSGKPRWTCERKQAFAADVASGLSPAELAEKYGSSRGAMKRRMVPVDAKLRRSGDRTDDTKPTVSA